MLFMQIVSLWLVIGLSFGIIQVLLDYPKIYLKIVNIFREEGLEVPKKPILVYLGTSLFSGPIGLLIWTFKTGKTENDETKK